jgi:branched-chain amino acid transport system substrate-binding protein
LFAFSAWRLQFDRQEIWGPEEPLPVPAYARIAARPLAAGLLSARPALAETIIGVAGPMSGSLVQFGDEMRDGAQQAIDDINAAGGVNGAPLALEAMDDKCDPKTADAVANQLAGKGAAMVVGHLCLGASLAAASVYVATHIVEISPGTTWPDYTDKRPGPGIYRLAGRDDHQGVIAGEAIAHRFPDKAVTVIDDRSPYGKALADATRHAMNAAGKREAFTEEYDPGQRDFTGLAERLQAANIGVLYIGGYPTEAGLIARQIRASGLDTVIVGPDALVTDEYRDVAGDAAEGTLVTFTPDARENPTAVAAVQAFRDRGVEPEGYVLPSYAAVEVWAQAAKAAGSNDHDAVVKAMDGGRFATVHGDQRIDAKGDMSLPGFVLYEWRGGRLARAGN